MKPMNMIIGLLFFALFLAVLATPAAASWETTEWIEGGSDGYMINNVIIEVAAIGISKDENGTISGNLSLSAWEWKNDEWVKNANGSTKLSLNGTVRFNASDGEYSVTLVDLREIGKFNEAKLEMWTNAVVSSNKGLYIKGGHANATGAGSPNLVITKVVTPTENVSVDDVLTVMVYVHNTGNYDAKNVNINDPYPAGFLMLPATVNNTVNQTINKNTNNTYLVYQIKAAETGRKTLPAATATGENNLGMSFSYVQTNSVAIEVGDLAALTFTSSPMSGNTVDYYTRSKIDGTIVVRNTGTMPAQFISVEFMLPNNAIISGKDIVVNGNKASVYIDYLTPNNERIIHYSLSATAEGHYEVTAGYNYTYNNSTKTGGLETVVYRAVGSNTVSKLLDNWYLLLIPVILIAAVAVFVLKRRNEYRY